MQSVVHNFNPDPNAPPAVDYMIPSQNAISMSGNFARRLLENELDVGVFRPVLHTDGRTTYITRNIMGADGKMHQKNVRTFNDTNATLRFLDWIELDNAVMKASKPPLRATQELINGGLVYRMPNGIAKSVLQYQQQSTVSGATISMDGLRQNESDRPVFSLIQFPLPIIHKDFQYPLRQILESRQGYSPLDTTTAAECSRRVAEQAEQLVLGCGANSNFAAPGQFLGQTSYTWGGNTIYGMTNYPNRITYGTTLPTAAGWTPQQTINDMLAMQRASMYACHGGPWRVYFGYNWNPYMEDDYKPTYNGVTLRQRLAVIDGLQSITTIPYISDYSLLMVEQNPEVIRLVIGMDIMIIQWESHGGMELNFKVMCVMVPQIRTDIYGNTGLVHGNG